MARDLRAERRHTSAVAARILAELASELEREGVEVVTTEHLRTLAEGLKP